MFRILCDPSSGSTELCFTEITRSDSQIFTGNQPAVPYTHTHTHAHAHTQRFKITLPNTDQAHDKISVNQHE
jgi:hypothetical protein